MRYLLCSVARLPGFILVDGLGLLLPADGLPEAGAVVEVVRRHGAVFLRGLQRLDADLGRRLGERGEDSARVEPPDALVL